MTSSSASPTQSTVKDERSLLPVLPMIYVAWVDGTLTADEIGSIRELMESEPWFDEAARRRVRGWLDPSAPPSPGRLQALLTAIRWLAQAVPEAERRTLADLGVALAQKSDDPKVAGWSSAEAAEALRQLEAALGVVSEEACRELVADGASAAVAAPAVEVPFDVSAMTRVLDGEYRSTREEIRRLLCEPQFRYEYGLDAATHRERVFAWCVDLANRGLGAAAYPAAYGGGDDIGRFMTIFQTLAFFDLSLVVKFGVQFGLFGGSVQQLGTAMHHERYLRDVGTLALPGCFAMSETGHGSNVRDLETTAQFDRETDEFVIHTPTDAACKDWIGNAAVHGRVATVFAQLLVNSVEHGVHAFVVPIRNADGTPCSGVHIEDCGPKLGLNGVDNGRLWFDRVRVPRENLLNRFGTVDAGGEYRSPIISPARRFFTMLGTLVGGRVSVAGAALSGAKSGLTIAIRYGARRRQFGPAGKPETLILDYLNHQRRLFPRLATVYALDFTIRWVMKRFIERSETDQREIETLAAGIKAFSTWNTVETLQACREACGGQGYLAVNRFADLKADTDVFATFEGDNAVLMQLVAKGLLTDFRAEFGDIRFFGILKYLARRTAVVVTELNPVVTRLTDESHLRDPEFHLNAFQYRERRLLRSVAQRLKRLIDDGQDSFTALNACQDHLVLLANAHIERVVFERFRAGITEVDGQAERAVLESLAVLFALSRIERDRGWFLEVGYIEGRKSKAIRAMINQLCREIRHAAVPLVDAFGIPDQALAAPIAL